MEDERDIPSIPVSEAVRQSIAKGGPGTAEALAALIQERYPEMTGPTWDQLGEAIQDAYVMGYAQGAKEERERFFRGSLN